MLKIKDNVDLKELEKFGYEKNEPFNYIKHLVDKPYYLDSIQVDLKTRKITRHIKQMYEPETKCKRVISYCIIDLINADLVEKVEV